MRVYIMLIFLKKLKDKIRIRRTNEKQNTWLLQATTYNFF
jgi:hypothetical protein